MSASSFMVLEVVLYNPVHPFLQGERGLLGLNKNMVMNLLVQSLLIFSCKIKSHLHYVVTQPWLKTWKRGKLIVNQFWNRYITTYILAVDCKAWFHFQGAHSPRIMYFQCSKQQNVEHVLGTCLYTSHIIISESMPIFPPVLGMKAYNFRVCSSLFTWCCVSKGESYVIIASLSELL